MRPLLKSNKKRARKSARKPPGDALDQLRPGMPAKDSIRKVVDFVSPQDTRYEILKTTEADAYDPIPEPKKKSGSTS
jgi:hypothetical protein